MFISFKVIIHLSIVTQSFKKKKTLFKTKISDHIGDSCFSCICYWVTFCWHLRFPNHSLETSSLRAWSHGNDIWYWGGRRTSGLYITMQEIQPDGDQEQASCSWIIMAPKNEGLKRRIRTGILEAALEICEPFESHLHPGWTVTGKGQHFHKRILQS